jgi:hypothetical protein
MSELWTMDWTAAMRALLDIGLAALVGLLAWRLRSEAAPRTGEEWDQRERRLREVHESLRRLVTQAHEDARLLDARLGAQVAQAESTLRSAEAVLEAIRQPRVLRATAAGAPEAADPVVEARPTFRPRVETSPPSVAERVQALVAEDLTAEEIARRVELPIADVRFLMALGARGKSPVVEGVA